MGNKKTILLFLLPVLVSFILHFHVLKLDLIGYHVWRQTQTQTVIYHFNFSDNSIFHPQKFDITNGTTELIYEFPLYQWIIAQVNVVMGYSVMNTRMVSFFIFTFFLLGFFKLLRKFAKEEIALISNALICFSPLLYYYGINPLPDTMALCLAIWSLNFFFDYLNKKNNLSFILFAVFLMVASLVKLPFILFGGGLILYLYRKFIRKEFKEPFIKLVVFLIILIPVALWYCKAIPTWKGNEIVSGLFANKHSLLQLLDYFLGNLISTVPELVTNYASCLFLLVGIYLFFKKRKFINETQTYFVFLFVLFSFYFLFELNMIGTAHDYYLMPFVPFIFLVVTIGVRYFYEKNYKKFVFFIVCLVPLTAWLRIDTRWNLENPGFITDYLTNQNQIQSLIPKNEKCIIDYDDSHFVSLYYLKRYGYSLYKNELNPSILEDRFLKGASFFITENLSLNLNEFPKFNFEEIYNKNLKIYKLSLK